jgi:hypothetical protein
METLFLAYKLLFHNELHFANFLIQFYQFVRQDFTRFLEDKS